MMLLVGVGGGNAHAAEQKEWYVYYNDSHMYSKEYVNSFQKYLNWNYTAVHTSRSNSSVCTLIQPGSGTSFQKPSYVVGSSQIKFFVVSAIYDYVYVKSVLSYNTAPASSSGIVTRPNTAS